MIKKILGLLFLLISANIIAQKTNNSPYSVFGIGSNTTAKTVEEISMGEIGGAYNSVYQLNFSNPASLAHLRFTNYLLAAQNKANRIDDGKTKASSSSASISYLAFGFPVGNKAGLAFGLKPNTSSGYSISQEFRATDGELDEVNLFTGKGGTNSLFIGFGHKIGKNFSLGIEASYIFGSVEESLLNRRRGVPLASLDKTDTDVRALHIKTGLQYVNKVNDKLTAKGGLIVDLKNDLSNKGRRYLLSLINRPDGIVTPRDTIINAAINETYNFPTKTTLSAGIGEENKWYAGVEYAFQNAVTVDKVITQNNVNFRFKNANRLSFGGFYTPKSNSVSSYWQRITYRAGVKIEETGLMVNNTSINDFGISFGVGLPLGRQLSSINLGFELGQRGKSTDGLVKENYFNFRVGLSLIDRWFNKQKLD